MKRLANGLFVAATFTSAFVLFAMQPFAARSLLPKYGGAPHVWVTTAVFFQVAVLLGYGYAHVVPKRVSPRALTFLHAGLAALVVLSYRSHALLDSSHALSVGTSPILSLFGALALSVFAPALFLASTSPIVQLFLARTGLRPNPYSLYVASNGGSLLALVSYPFLVEPFMGLNAQSVGLYVALALAATFIGASAIVAYRLAPTGEPEAAEKKPDEGADAAKNEAAAAKDTTDAPPDRKTQIAWFWLAFAPSLLLSSTTLHVTTDVAAIPLFWVVPLGLYLVSFMVAFGRYGEKVMPIVRRATIFFALLVVVALNAKSPSVWVLIPHAAFLSIACIACHGILASKRPAPKHLTRFYFVMSLGGAAGGAVCSIVAPLLFRDLWEYPIAIVLVVWLVVESDEGWKKQYAAVPFVFAALTFVFGWLGQNKLGLHAGPLAAVTFGPVVLLAYGLSGRRHAFTLALAGSLLTAAFLLEGNLLFRNRSFFGVLRVKEDNAHRFRAIVNGTTSHGLEDIANPGRPLAYFFRTGPAGDIFKLLEPPPDGPGNRVYIIGLGIGALGSYAEPHDQFTFFELDALDVTLARDSGFFHALSTMKSPSTIVVGDARLELERIEKEHPGQKMTDMLVVDAFSSDMIPVHLLTVEAVKLYDRLSSKALLFHVSNQFANLVPITSAAARDAGFSTRVRVDLEITNAEMADGKRASVWCFASKDEALLHRLETTNPAWKIPTPAKIAWTDDRADVVSTLGASFEDQKGK